MRVRMSLRGFEVDEMVFSSETRKAISSPKMEVARLARDVFIIGPHLSLIADKLTLTLGKK